MFKNYKSPETFNLKTLVSQVMVMNSNILYMTHEIDQIKKIVIKISNSQNSQKQVDDFYSSEDSEHIPEAVE